MYKLMFDHLRPGGGYKNPNLETTRHIVDINGYIVFWHACEHIADSDDEWIDLFLTGIRINEQYCFQLLEDYDLDEVRLFLAGSRTDSMALVA